MRETSAAYKTLRSQTGAFYEVEVIQGNKTYKLEDLYEVKISPILFDGSGPSIGNACSSLCEVTLKEESANWPRMAKFTVRVRLCSADGQTKTGWLPMGAYWTDERAQDRATGKLSITAYDGMMKYEKNWTDYIPEPQRPTTWPITAKAWIDLFENVKDSQDQSKPFFDFDERSMEIDDTVPLIGLSTTSTVRDVMKIIAGAHGGNWVVTYENKLRLVPLSNISVASTNAVAGIAIAGIAIVGTGLLDSGDEDNIQNLGMKVMSLETTPELAPVSGVHLETEGGSVAEAGTKEHYVLQAICDFASSQGVAELCLENTEGYVYKPFEAGTALLDPAAEIGDCVIIDGESYQMMAIDWNISTWPTADISAPFEEEVDHEYTVVTEDGKHYKKVVEALDGVGTKIEQTERNVEIAVQNTTTLEGTVDQNKTDADQQYGELDGRIDAIYTHYNFTEEGEVIGNDASNKRIRLNYNGIYLTVDEDAVVIITQDEMVAPKKVNIPLSGSLQMGNFLFQPRSSGNMSLLWVGES